MSESAAPPPEPAPLTDGKLSDAFDKTGFWALMVTQFQGAFSDQAIKQLLIFFVLALNLGHEKEVSLTSQVGAIFAVPFLLFSMFAGWLADRFSKRSIMIGVKAAEVLIMLFATYAFATWTPEERKSGQIGLLLVAVCLMGLHSTIFGPSKYGVLPEILPQSRLSWGNGYLELLTFFGLIGGMWVAGELAERFGPGTAAPGWVLVALAVVGLSTSFRIARVPAADPQKPFRVNFLADLWQTLRKMMADSDLWRALWGNTVFWYIAALIGLLLPIYAEHQFHLGPRQISFMNMSLSVGIGIGSGLAGYLSRGRIEYGLIPPGAGIMAIVACLMGLPSLTPLPFAIMMGILGIGCGLFIVPIAAVLQHRPAADEKGAVQGATNFVSWIGIILSSVTLSVMNDTLRRPARDTFICAGVVAGLVGIYVALSRPKAVPDMLARWFRRA